MIDARGRHIKVDWKWLTAIIVGAIGAAKLAFALLPDGIDYLVLVILAVAGITFDIWSRRKHPEPRPWSRAELPDRSALAVGQSCLDGFDRRRVDYLEI